MLQLIENKIIIVSNEAKLNRYANDTCTEAANIFQKLNKNIGCTYLIYMYENLLRNEKYVYSSNWEWQNLLIGNRLINHCPIFLTAFKYLENKKSGHIFIPWHQSPPSNKNEREVCGIRSEFNIANGFGYAAKGYGIRESLAFGGDIKDNSFYKNFITNPNIFYTILQEMHLIILMQNNNIKKIPDSTMNKIQ